MKYYGERTKQLYDSEKACLEAEAKAKEQENLEKIRKERELALAKEQKEKAAAERKAMADKVEAARKAMVSAQKAYREELEKFIKAYGTYHYTVANTDEVPSLFDVFKYAFNW